MPGSGKTTLGKKAAAALGMQFYDTDVFASDQIRAEFRSRPQTEGQEASFFFYFRNKIETTEKTVVERIAREAANAVIATGAETTLSPDNAQVLRSAGRFVYIKRDPDLMLKEIKEKFIPDTKNPKVRNWKEFLVYEYHDALPEYERLADFTVENDSGVEAGLEKLIEIIRAETGRTAP
jgi:shikimate kinase